MKYLRTNGTRWAVTLALFGLFMQIFIPLAQAISIGEEEDGFPSRMVICTLYGIKVIDIITGEEAPSKTDSSRETCPVCLAFSIGDTSLTGVPELSTPVPVHTSSFVVTALEAVLSTQSNFNRYAARAPPALS
jgi:hypothetical protein